MHWQHWTDYTRSQLAFAKVHHEIKPREKNGGGLGLGELPKIMGSPVIFLQRLGLATLSLALSWGLSRHFSQILIPNIDTNFTTELQNSLTTLILIRIIIIVIIINKIYHHIFNICEEISV